MPSLQFLTNWPQIWLRISSFKWAAPISELFAMGLVQFSGAREGAKIGLLIWMLLTEFLQSRPRELTKSDFSGLAPIWWAMTIAWEPNCCQMLLPYPLGTFVGVQRSWCPSCQNNLCTYPRLRLDFWGRKAVYASFQWRGAFGAMIGFGEGDRRQSERVCWDLLWSTAHISTSQRCKVNSSARARFAHAHAQP